MLTLTYSEESELPARNFFIFGVAPCGRIARLRVFRDLALNAKSVARAVGDGASVVATMDWNLNFFDEIELVRVVVFYPFLLFFISRRLANTKQEKKKKKTKREKTHSFLLSSSSSHPFFPENSFF